MILQKKKKKMKPLSKLGLGLTLVFGFLVLALIAELYYLLWWKKKGLNDSRPIEEEEEEKSIISPDRGFSYKSCWKKPSSLSSTKTMNPQDLEATETHFHISQPNKERWLMNAFGDGEGGVEEELMRLHHLSGPPKFLFPIKEETKEDLESEDGKSRKGSRTRSLSDLIGTLETPFWTPLASPPYFTPPLTPPMELGFNSHGFNPLFESSVGPEMRWVKSSPPPKFKFLKDAEEKLHRRKLDEDAVQKDELG